jgi:Cyclic nucleotide-binding domain
MCPSALKWGALLNVESNKHMNNTRFAQSHIRRLPLFARLTPEQVQQVAAVTHVLNLQQGQIVYQQGQPAQGMYLFVSGRGMLTRIAPNGHEEQVGVISEGQYVGEETLYSERIEPYSLRIAEPAIVLLIPKGQLAMLVAAQPAIRSNVGMAQSNPQHVIRLFKGQRDDETVLQIFKRHWWAFARKAWLPLLIATLMIVGAGLTLAAMPPVALGLFGLAIIIPGGIALLLYADWQDDVLIVTDQRLIKINDTLLMFDKTINEIPLERAHEVNAEIPPDPFARLFGYGTVVIRTGGAGGNIAFDTVSAPERIQKLIFAQRDRYQQGSEDRARNMISADLDRVIRGGAPPMGDAQAQPMGAVQNVANEGGFDSLNPLRTRFTDTNGDTVYRHHVSIWLRHITLPFLVILGAGVLFIASFVFPQLAQSPINVGVLASIGMGLFGTIIRKRPLWLQNEKEIVRLDQVDNVVSEVQGIIDNLLNRGNIKISLIGGDANDAKVFRGVGDPQSIQSEISQRLVMLRHDNQNADVVRQRQAIADYLTAYHQRTAPGGQPYQAPPSPNAPYAPPTYYPPQSPDVPPPNVRDANRPPNVPRVRGDR